MLKLKRLKILQYRNVKPGTELRFDDGLNLILGQNASGKTTLLALLSAVCRSTFEGIADEELALEYELRGERHTVTTIITHRRTEPSDPDGVFGAQPRWEDDYAVTIDDRDTGRQTTIVFAGGDPVARGGESDPARSVMPSRVPLVMEWSFIAASLSNRGAEWAGLRSEILQTFGFSYRFDESLDCFLAITGRSSALPSSAAPPVAHAGLVEHHDRQGGTSSTAGAFVPHALALALQTGFRAAIPGRRPLNLDGAEQDLSRRLARILDVSDVSITPNVVEQRVTNGDRSFRVEGFTFEVTRADGTTIHHDRLSYGQKRLLSFLYYLECNPYVVIADELVNGLHHRWIDACMEAMAGRQAFLTSQNPLLFDYVDFDSVERVASSFITCKLELVDGREQLVWQNMSAQDATIFFEAYEVGIEHVGDILITRGLW
jgi:energy-coupling factor transporter ATP-binding protein EcfA2